MAYAMVAKLSVNCLGLTACGIPAVSAPPRERTMGSFLPEFPRLMPAPAALYVLLDVTGHERGEQEPSGLVA
jgi:hypothetical protein